MDNKLFLEEEKKLLQAKHQLESAEARDRKKERNQRTRRLIQLGALFESVCPRLRSMEIEEIKNMLEKHMENEKEKIQ